MNFNFLNTPLLFGLSMEVYIICFVIALTTFFICKRLLKKIIRTDSTRKLTTWVITLLAIPLIYLALIQLLIFWINYTPSRDFDKSIWLNDKEGRFQMALDLIDSKLLMGKDTNQVKQLLGDPTFGMNNENSYTYDMGFGGGGLGFMFHHLIVKFESNKVVSVEHAKIRD